MKQQILIIGGGNTYANHGAYIKNLKETEPDLGRMRYKSGWKHNLQRDLGEDYDVLLPQMPKPSDASYSEWDIYFTKIIPLLDENVILIGHSLGSIFLAGWLSYNRRLTKTKAVILIAAPFDDEENESLGDFFLPESLENLRQSTEELWLLHSEDDTVVPFSELGKYENMLPNAKVMTFTDRGHFNEESFPELVGILKAL